ncbi:tRNA (adenosine(37)-N6)-threonylcarbamoyltransferase complex dimerization subunit type 1 TsaB [Brochothrix campestris]|uniref:Glycoprotease n=1 Tax=Brochothrix campestris FSL F6-1037 TaxID=1265861 RepID=W7CXX8_9LIST|nr:tRNA (adenosine(37)-N6)-threonylcarbamoyltransferase complex dimerization subunit type 1 TsaB [Brochothrix campestris]EUJ41787.1 glycoprotease [Brochothrix campestris FSL F6-1037]
MVTLAIDSSAKAMTVGLVNDETVLGEITLNVQQNHSVQLMPAIEYLMAASQVTPQQLSAIAVAQGPGSYTGLRIGVTIAKTLAWDLKLPLYGVSTLRTLADNITVFDGLIVSLVDARRNAVFAGIYRRAAIGDTIETVVTDQYVTMPDLLEQLAERQEAVMIVASAADISLYQAQIEEHLAQTVFADTAAGMPSGARLALLAQYEKPQDVHTFVPTYIRMTEAETNWRKAQGLD